MCKHSAALTFILEYIIPWLEVILFILLKIHNITKYIHVENTYIHAAWWHAAVHGVTESDTTED